LGRIASIHTVVAELNSGAVGGMRRRRDSRLSRAFHAALKLQGKYMGTMWGLTARKRAIVKKVGAAKGIRMAIAAAEMMAS